MKGLLSYTVSHFDQEEFLFEKTNYPEAEKHKQMHRAFTKKIYADHERLSNLDRLESIKRLSSEISEYLTKWLGSHILEVDQAYVDFVRPKKKVG